MKTEKTKITENGKIWQREFGDLIRNSGLSDVEISNKTEELGYRIAPTSITAIKNCLYGGKRNHYGDPIKNIILEAIGYKPTYEKITPPVTVCQLCGHASINHNIS